MIVKIIICKCKKFSRTKQMYIEMNDAMKIIISFV
jgi:hypothetical protein